MYKYQSADALGVLTEMQKNLATVQRPPLILLGLLLGPTGPGPDMLYQSAVCANWFEVSADNHDGSHRCDCLDLCIWLADAAGSESAGQHMFKGWLNCMLHASHQIRTADSSS